MLSQVADIVKLDGLGFVRNKKYQSACMVPQHRRRRREIQPFSQHTLAWLGGCPPYASYTI